MGRIGKAFAFVLVCILAASCLTLLVTKPANAQSVPTPSVPQFTVKFVNASYSVTTTNVYTGQNETQQVSNNSIEITIKNQQFDYSNNGLTYQIYFNVRAKPHFADNWTELYPLENVTSSNAFSYAQYIDDSLPQSNSSYTISSFPVVPTGIYGASGYDIQRYYSGNAGNETPIILLPTFLTAIPFGGQIDFQVQALVGHAFQYWVIQHPFYPTIGGYSAPAIAYDSASAWSDIQTVTIGQTSLTPSSTAAVPELSWLVIVPLLPSIFSVAMIFRRRKNH